MLKLVIPGVEHFDEENQEFITIGDKTLYLEHSLISVSKWESEFEKPFLGKEERTTQETLRYIELMILGEDSTLDFRALTDQHIRSISAYITSKRSATFFNDSKKGPASSETITSELIYYWMVAHTIPFECANWHLNRLLNLIKICNLKSEPPKKMSRSEIAARNRELNAKRRSELGTKG